MPQGWAQMGCHGVPGRCGLCPEVQECEDEINARSCPVSSVKGQGEATKQGPCQHQPKAISGRPHGSGSFWSRICVRPVPGALSRERSWGRGQVDHCH